MDKNIVRNHGKEARKNLTQDERAHFSAIISGRILESEEFKEATTVMIYKSMKSEVCLDGLEGEGKKIAYPYCINKTDMTALVPSADDAWAPGAFGILEPQPEKSEVIMPEDIDLVICPCTAFDENGNRMGMGAGYYDRFLEKCVNAKIIAVAFDCQKVDTVPSEPHDVRMQKVYTEKKIYEF